MRFTSSALTGVLLLAVVHLSGRPKTAVPPERRGRGIPAGEPPYMVGVRFKLEELDAMVE